MTTDELISSLDLPAGAVVNRRVPKTLVIENANPASADKRAIQEGIEEIRWVAAVKPTTAGIATYRDEEREYLEIAVVYLKLREDAKKDRLVELLHRAIPYPIILFSETKGFISISLAEKRKALNEVDRFVVDGDILEVIIDDSLPHDILASFLRSMSLTRGSADTIRALYISWIDSLIALNVSRITGSIVFSENPVHSADRRAALTEIIQLDKKITSVSRAAAKERNVSRQVDLNLEYARLKSARKAALKKL